MKNKYNYVYVISILAIFLILIFVKNINDMIEMGLYASAIVLTSIFTYSNRKKRYVVEPNKDKTTDESIDGSEE